MSEPTARLTIEALNVSQVVLKYLTLEGVDTVFGIPGGALGNLLVALKNERHEIRYIICRQETGAAYAADGYHRATGKLGVVMTTSGPGATNALTGTMNAQADGSALLTLTGEIPEANFGMGYLQEGVDCKLDVNAVYKAATGYSTLITSPQNFGTLFTQSLRDALTIPRQAVHVSLPNDVAGMPAGSVVFPRTPENYRAMSHSASRDDARRTLDILTNAKRPLLLVGNGCRIALRGERREKLIAFAERYQIPVATTPDGKGLFPETHPLSLRVYGTGGCEWPYYYFKPTLVDPSSPPYDALVVLASKLGGFATNKWDPRLVPAGPIVQVDADSSVIARAFPVELGSVGEIGSFLDWLDELSPEFPPDPAVVESRRTLVHAIREKSPFENPASRRADTAPLQPAALMRCLDETLPDDAMLFVDAGNSVGWVLHYFVQRDRIECHSALDMGPMGFGVGAAMGAKRGAPHRACVGVVGDGAFLMHGNEVSTASTNGIGVIWIVLYDDQLNMVTQGQGEFFPDPKDPDVWAELYQLGKPKLADFSRALGADAYDVHDPKEAVHALRRALAGAETGRPQVIVAHIDTKPVPPYYQKGPTLR